MVLVEVEDDGGLGFTGLVLLEVVTPEGRENTTEK